MKAKVPPINAAHVQNYDAAKEKENGIIGKKIQSARKECGLTLSDLSARLQSYGVKVSRGAASKWETGETVPNAYQLVAVINALGMDESVFNFMEDYVPALNEAGRRKVSEYREDLIATGKYRPTPKRNSNIQYIDMRISNLRVSAGTGSILDEGNFEKISFPKDKVPEDADFGIRVSGDSMEPVYHDGQIVWVQECERVGIGEVGVFICDGEGFLKAYDEQEPDETIAEDFTDSYGNIHPQAMLVSYNQAYETKVIPPDSELRVVGRVL